VPDNNRVVLLRALRALPVVALLLGASTGQAIAQVSDPTLVVDAYERARTTRNVDAALATFADDAVVRLVDRGTFSFSGKVDIRRFLQDVAVRNVPLLVSNRHVAGTTVTWTERDQFQAQSAVDLSVEAIVQDGKIKSLQYRVGTSPTADGRAVQAGEPLPATIALAAVVALGVVLLAAASLGSRRRPSASTLRGKLMTSLGEFHR
jgi:hypothetical protein